MFERMENQYKCVFSYLTVPLMATSPEKVAQLNLDSLLGLNLAQALQV